MVSQLTEAMIIVRTAGRRLRAARLPETATAPQPQPAAA
jgi:hypothetical protein